MTTQSKFKSLDPSDTAVLEAIRGLLGSGERSTDDLNTLLDIARIADSDASRLKWSWASQMETINTALRNHKQLLDTAQESVGLAQAQMFAFHTVNVPAILSASEDEVMGELRAYLKGAPNLSGYPVPRFSRDFALVYDALEKCATYVDGKLAKARASSESELKHLSARIARLQSQKKEQDQNVQQLSQGSPWSAGFLSKLNPYSKHNRPQRSSRLSADLERQLREAMDKHARLSSQANRFPGTQRWQELVDQIARSRVSVDSFRDQLVCIPQAVELANKAAQDHIDFLSSEGAKDPSKRAQQQASIESAGKMTQSFSEALLKYSKGLA